MTICSSPATCWAAAPPSRAPLLGPPATALRSPRAQCVQVSPAPAERRPRSTAGPRRGHGPSAAPWCFFDVFGGKLGGKWDSLGHSFGLVLFWRWFCWEYVWLFWWEVILLVGSWGIVFGWRVPSGKAYEDFQFLEVTSRRKAGTKPEEQICL